MVDDTLITAFKIAAFSIDFDLLCAESFIDHVGMSLVGRLYGQTS
jgi:hypothetical protein